MRSLLILSFIIIIAIISLCDDLSSAMLIVSILTNFIVLSLCLKKIEKNTVADVAAYKGRDEFITPDTAKPSAAANIGPGASGAATNDTPQYNETPMYDQTHINAQNFKDSYFSYPSPKLCDVSTRNIDNSNISLARSRARDRRGTDGWVTKNANYFANNYGTEFADEENKEWWGRKEY